MDLSITSPLFDSLFLTASDITKWNKTFPNPEESPAGHVRDLSFCYIQPDVPIEFADRMPYFSNVQKFTLIGRVATNPSLISALVQSPPTARSVDVTCSKVLTAHVISLIQQIPNLDNLSLMATERGGATPPAGTGKPVQSRFYGTLRLLRQMAHLDILNTLMETPAGPQFAEVEIRDASKDCFPAALKLVGACQDAITELHFSVLVLGNFSASRTRNVAPEFYQSNIPPANPSISLVTPGCAR